MEENFQRRAESAPGVIVGVNLFVTRRVAARERTANAQQAVWRGYVHRSEQQGERMINAHLGDGGFVQIRKALDDS